MIGVVGGSITVGHGLEKEDKKWPQLLEEGLKRVYPESVVEVRNGAVP